MDQGLTYQFVADRLDGYVLEERLMLRQMEEKVSCWTVYIVYVFILSMWMYFEERLMLGQMEEKVPCLIMYVMYLFV